LVCIVKIVNGRGIGIIFSLSLRETCKIFHRGGITVPHVKQRKYWASEIKWMVVTYSRVKKKEKERKK